jgi:hypothetical protein
MNCVDTAENWMHTFDEENIDDMGISLTQTLPSFVEYTTTKSYDFSTMPLIEAGIMSMPTCNNMLHSIDFANTTNVNNSLVTNIGAEHIMGGYHAAVFNTLTNSPIVGKLPSLKIPRGGFDAASKRPTRQARKKPLCQDKIDANVIKNRQNAAKERLRKEGITNGLKETVIALQESLIESQRMLTQVSLSLHSEMKISADLRSEVKRLGSA